VDLDRRVQAHESVGAMKEFTLHTELWLPRSRGEIFPFFAEARNLEAITPPWLRFEVLTPAPVEMRRGTLIDYRLRVHGVPICWRTEIAEWEPLWRFVDVQRRGPMLCGTTRTPSRNTPVERSAPTACVIVRGAGCSSTGSSCDAMSDGYSSIGSSG